MNAAEIIQAMARAYATCRTYRDRGTVVTRYPSFSEERPFTTAFVRPDRFRFEFRNQFPNSTEWHPYIVWQNGSEVRSWRHGEDDREESLCMAVAGATGVSGGSGHTVPRMLLPNEVGGTCLTDIVNLHSRDDDTTDGVRCYRIDGAYPRSNWSWALWIDKTTLLLRRIKIHDRFGQIDSETTYDPAIDVAITEAELELDVPETE